ncbi:MAG: DUF4097 family beta strand repeat-containing protein, partial [Acidobacteriota bacterium]|nr:DUF4097 family beta strand repeat-containing protein [Acidobacteriota bacterium]
VADLLSRYWPFILIAWGGLRLMEILFWAATKKPLPRSGISGSEWLVIIFLCVIGSAMYQARHWSWMPNGRSLRGMMINMGESYDFTVAPVHKTVASAPRIVLESFRGNARITGGDGDQVTVNGRKTIRSFQQPDADTANGQTPLELIQQGDQLIVRTNQDRVNDNLRVSEDLEITVPRGSSIEAHGRMGDFDIREIAGSVDIVSDNAGVRIDNVGGNVRVEVRKSDIVRATAVKGSVDLKGRGHDLDLQNIDGQVSINGDFVGQVQFKNLAQPLRLEGSHLDLQFEKLPGQLHMGTGDFNANNIIGPVRLSARARDVQISDFTQALELSLDRGDIELRPGARNPVPRMDVRIKSGDIDLALPVLAKFDINLGTSHGEAHNEFGSPLSVHDENHGATIVGSAPGGPSLKLRTDRGTVTARKAVEELKVQEQ